MSDLKSYFSFKDIGMRRANNGDVEVLVALINAAYSYQDKVKGEQRTNLSHLRKRMAETDFYVLTDEGHIMGCVYIEPAEKTLRFGLLTLEDSYRGKGIAGEVISAVEDFGKANGFKAVALDYMSLAPWLKNYYEKYGFIETGEVLRWGEIDLVRMRKSL